VRRVAILGVAVLAASLPLGRTAPPEVPHPLAYWVRADAWIFGPSAWSITVRNGGYYTGYTGWLDGEFNGQLSPTQREELARVLARLPREDRAYHFGTALMEGPHLTLQLQQPPPTIRYWVGVVSEAEEGDSRLRSVVEVAEVLLRLVPDGEEQGTTPWRGRSPNERRGRTRG
jgi:hypothetical protein